MALVSSDLQSNLKNAFQSGMDGASSDEVAASVTDAIVSYASGATILMVPGPILIPAAPTPVPSTGQNQMLESALHETGRATLLSGIQGQFSSQDATLMTMALAIQTYANTSFTLFQSTIGHMATGATVMAVPPALSTIAPAGLAGSSLDDTASQMATLIHAAFIASIFTGSGVAIDGGLGFVTGPLM